MVSEATIDLHNLSRLYTNVDVPIEQYDATESIYIIFDSPTTSLVIIHHDPNFFRIQK